MPRHVGPVTVTLHSRSWIWPRLQVALVRTRAPGRWVYKLLLHRWNVWVEVGRGPGEACPEGANGAHEEPEPPTHPHPGEGPGPGAAA